MPRRRQDPQAYRIGWICPLEVEQMAAMEMLDEEHDGLPQKPADHNIYKLSSINNHNIVITGLPTPGNCPAAAVAQMRMTFPNLRYGLLVGIGGGVPIRTKNGIMRLGHVVVGTPTGVQSGTVQYDHGKAKDGAFERTGSILPPPALFLNAARALAVERERLDQDPVWKDAQRPLERRRARRFRFPGVANDHYPRYYTHQQPGEPCTEGGCDPGEKINRHIEEDEESFVAVHRGIASGEQVVKTATLRDRLADQHGCYASRWRPQEHWRISYAW
jgi:hypothetical protein